MAFGPQLGFFFMKKLKPAIFYFDGQNLYRRARAVFSNIKHPNFDPVALSKLIAEKHSFKIQKIKFYTGIPPKGRFPHWHKFWSRKLTLLGKNNLVETFTRQTRLRKETVLIDNKEHEIEFDVEKGIDVRIAIDIVRDVFYKHTETVVIFSQDQDLSEVAKEIKKIGKKEQRYISVFSAFPYPSTSLPIYRQGIHGTNWIRISETDYNQCIDTRDYR